MISHRCVLVGVLLLVFSQASVAKDVVLGLLTDGPVQRHAVPPEVLQREIADLMGTEFNVSMPSSKRLNGGWSLEGIRTAHQKLQADREIDAILVLGPVASQVAADAPNLRKPVIAAIVVNAALQQFPLIDGISGKRNFVYLASFHNAEDEVTTFRQVVGFKKLAVLVDELTLEAIPSLKPMADNIARKTGIDVILIAAAGSVEQVLAGIPSDADAVYVTPLLRLSLAQVKSLSDGLIARRLPSFSLLGRSEVEQGLLMTTQPESDDVRLARRVGLNLQRILLGEDAGTIQVAFPISQRTTLNMRTANAIDFSPRFAILADADKLFDEEESGGRELTMITAVQDALRLNPDLNTIRLSIDIAQDETQGARSELLPQLGVSASSSRIDADRANPLIQAEQSSEAELNISQLIYSDRVRAGYQIAQLLEDAAKDEYNAAYLDTVQSAASTYLTLLRAKALEAVELSNVEVTRTNFDLAKVREAIGFSGRGDVLRWESQLAQDRQRVLAAEADRRRAETELNRVLHQPQDTTFNTVEAGLKEPLQVLSDPRFAQLIDNPRAWKVFQEFSIQQAIENSPELASINNITRAQQRQVTAARRSYYVPDISIQGSAGRILNRSGVGSDLTGTGLDDEEWNVGLVASLPLYTGGGRSSDLSRARNELSQLGSQRAALEDAVAARALAAMQQTGGSYPSIELSKDAARAAAENLELVTDAYGKGAVTVTDLIDAQDTALVSELAAAEAVYAFLIDYVEILRALGDFSLILDPASSSAWFDEVEAFFKAQGVKQ